MAPSGCEPLARAMSDRLALAHAIEDADMERTKAERIATSPASITAPCTRGSSDTA